MYGGWLTDNVCCLFGEWKQGRNAGGNISYPTLHINPQFAFDITAGRANLLLLLMLLADRTARRKCYV